MNKLISFLVFILLQYSCLAQPTISSFSPSSGPVGTLVTITGSNFNTTPASNTVYFGISKAAVLSATATTLTATVPYGATFQPVSVTVNNLTAYSKLPFVITFNTAALDFTSITFGTRYEVTGISNQGCSLGDFDSDGKDDFTASGDHAILSVRNTSTVSTYAFGPVSSFPTGNYPYENAVADFDGDGEMDIAMAKASGSSFEYGFGQLSVLRNTSSGGTIAFSSRIDLLANDGEINWYGIATGDFDKDGKPDIVITNNSGAGKIAVYRNTSTPGNLSFNAAIKYNTGFSPRLASVGDIDNDGKPEIVVANQGSNSISIFRNLCSPGIISFAPKADFATRSGSIFLEDARLADFNLDGNLDIAITDHFYPSPGTVSVFRNTSTPGNISMATRVDYITPSDPWAINCNDFNGDGKPDMAVTNYFSGTFTLYKNNSTAGGNITMQEQYTYTLPGAVRDIMSADMNGDGKPEIITQHVSSGVLVFGIHTNGFPLIPVPLSLLSFTARQENGIAVRLNWKTTEESGVGGFTIERSADGIHFAAIGTMPVNPLPLTVKDYVFTDRNPLKGINYYRLRINDQDGSSKLSNIVNVNILAQADLVLYPDPATEILNIKHPLLGTAPAQIMIYDISGKQIRQLSSNSAATMISLPVAALPGGSYMLSLEIAGQKLTKKFIKH